MNEKEEQKQDVFDENQEEAMNNVQNNEPESTKLGSKEEQSQELKLKDPNKDKNVKKIEQLLQNKKVSVKSTRGKTGRKKQNKCQKYFNRTCVQLYLGCMPPVKGNNIALGICNSLLCGCGLILTPFCDNTQNKEVLCCAGWFQLLTSVCGVGILFAFMTGLAFCFEDTCW